MNLTALLLAGACSTQAIPSRGPTPAAADELAMTTRPAADQVILEMIVQPARGMATGMRVLGDGRYQSLSDHDLVLDASQSLTVQGRTHGWSPVYSFTASELDEVWQAIEQAGFPSLQASYPYQGDLKGGSTLTWRAWADGQLHQVVVEGHPVNKLPVLEDLFQRFNRIHQWPAQSSTWVLRLEGGALRREVQGSAIGVEALLGVIRNLYDKRLSSPAEGQVVASGQAEVLLEITWRQDGEFSSCTRLYGDGRLTEEKEGQELLRRILSAQGVEQLWAAMDGAGLQDLPAIIVVP